MKDGGSAFPSEARFPCNEGMTLRDYFAGQALAGWVSDSTFTARCNYDVTAHECYTIADAMLAEREKHNVER